MEKITNLVKMIQGQRKLPVGFIPLASDKMASLVCLSPAGRWFRFWPRDSLIESMPPVTQKAVMLVLIEQLGGSTAKAAEKLGVSARTVEAWRQGKSPLPIAKAYEITEIIS